MWKDIKLSWRRTLFILKTLWVYNKYSLWYVCVNWMGRTINWYQYTVIYMKLLYIVLFKCILLVLLYCCSRLNCDGLKKMFRLWSCNVCTSDNIFLILLFSYSWSYNSGIFDDHALSKVYLFISYYPFLILKIFFFTLSQ